VAGKGGLYRDDLGHGREVAADAAPVHPTAARYRRQMYHHLGGVLDDASVIAGAVPFEHGELGMMRRRALAVAEHMRQLEDARQARGQQLFHREFGRGMEIQRPARLLVGGHELGRERHQMRFETGADLKRRGFDLQEVARREERPRRGGQPRPHLQHRPAASKDIRPPPGRSIKH
jgi:hypothetical protein